MVFFRSPLAGQCFWQTWNIFRALDSFWPSASSRVSRFFQRHFYSLDPDSRFMDFRSWNSSLVGKLLSAKNSFQTISDYSTKLVLNLSAGTKAQSLDWFQLSGSGLCNQRHFFVFFYRSAGVSRGQQSQQRSPDFPVIKDTSIENPLDGAVQHFIVFTCIIVHVQGFG